MSNAANLEYLNRLVEGFEQAGLRQCEELNGYYNADTEVFAQVNFEGEKANVKLVKGYDKNSREVSFEEVNTNEAVEEVLSFLA